MNTTPASSPPQSLSPEELEQVEKDLLEHILKSIDTESISPENVQNLAREFLASLPIHDKKELVETLDILGKKYPEAQSVYLDIARPMEEEERTKKLHDMAEQIKSGNIEKAIAIAKGEPSV